MRWDRHGGTALRSGCRCGCCRAGIDSTRSQVRSAHPGAPGGAACRDLLRSAMRRRGSGERTVPSPCFVEHSAHCTGRSSTERTGAQPSRMLVESARAASVDTMAIQQADPRLWDRMPRQEPSPARDGRREVRTSRGCALDMLGLQRLGSAAHRFRRSDRGVRWVRRHWNSAVGSPAVAFFASGHPRPTGWSSEEPVRMSLHFALGLPLGRRRTLVALGAHCPRTTAHSGRCARGSTSWRRDLIELLGCNQWRSVAATTGCCSTAGDWACVDLRWTPCVAACSRVRVCRESTSMSRAISRRTGKLIEQLRASTGKKGGPAVHRPSSFNQGVVGSSPARGANLQRLLQGSLDGDRLSRCLDRMPQTACTGKRIDVARRSSPVPPRSR